MNQLLTVTNFIYLNVIFHLVKQISPSAVCTHELLHY